MTSAVVSAPTDRYPSRRGGEPERRPRPDPVVWGSATGPLDPDQVRHFDEHGFLQVPDVFDTDEVEAIRRRMRHEMDEAGDDERVIREPGGTEVRSLFAIHRAPGLLRDTIVDERLAGVARQILDSDVYVHQSRVNYKPAFRGDDFQWHSDFETWHAEDGMPAPRCLSAVVALTANETWNGSLLVLPGSHRSFVSCPQPTPDRNHERSLVVQEVGVPDDASLTALFRDGGIHQCVGAAGSVLFFDCNLLHGSPSNISPQPRENLFVVYNSVENRLTEPFAAPRPRPEHLATRHGFEPVPR